MVILLPAIFPEIQAQNVKFGIKGGTTFSFPSVSNSYSYDEMNQIGFLLGMHLDFATGKKFTARMEADFINKPSDFSSIYYVDIPLNLIYNLPAKKNEFLLGGGPVFSFMTSEDYLNEYKTFDFGINLLAGYQWPLGFSINLNYTHGLTNIANPDQNISSYKNRYLGLTAGYIF
jgi:hypothetical protein